MNRPSFDEYWMQFARDAGSRGTCDRGRSGAVIVNENMIISTGYVGAPHHLEHCDDAGHLIHKVEYQEENGIIRDHCVRSAHAEINAITHAARPTLAGGTVYCKLVPCHACCAAIINVGIKRVVTEYDYQGSRLSKKWFQQAGVELVVHHPNAQVY